MARSTLRVTGGILLFALFGLIAGLLIPGGSRHAGDWHLVEVSGAVSLWRGLPMTKRSAPSSGGLLTPPFRIETGADGRISIARGEDVIRIEPNTTLELPAGSDRTTLTNFNQPAGRALFSVETRKARKFRVTTPYLVTLVKGTSFGVDVSETGAAVSVSEGIVAVTSSTTGSSADVTVGETARVSSGPDRDIYVGPTSSTASIAPATPTATATGQAALSGRAAPKSAPGAGPSSQSYSIATAHQSTATAAMGSTAPSRTGTAPKHITDADVRSESGPDQGGASPAHSRTELGGRRTALEQGVDAAAESSGLATRRVAGLSADAGSYATGGNSVTGRSSGPRRRVANVGSTARINSGDRIGRTSKTAAIDADNSRVGGSGGNKGRSGIARNNVASQSGALVARGDAGSGSDALSHGNGGASANVGSKGASRPGKNDGSRAEANSRDKSSRKSETAAVGSGDGGSGSNDGSADDKGGGGSERDSAGDEGSSMSESTVAMVAAAVAMAAAVIALAGSIGASPGLASAASGVATVAALASAAMAIATFMSDTPGADIASVTTAAAAAVAAAAVAGIASAAAKRSPGTGTDWPAGTNETHR